MHMRGTPKTMQSLTGYNDVTADVVAELSKPLHRLMLKGVADVIIDPGSDLPRQPDKTTSFSTISTKSQNCWNVPYW